MNREEYITQFRENLLPKYVKLAKDEPYIPDKVTQPIDDKPVGYYAQRYYKCRKCGELKPASDFFDRKRYCNECKKKYLEKENI